MRNISGEERERERERELVREEEEKTLATRYVVRPNHYLCRFCWSRAICLNQSEDRE